MLWGTSKAAQLHPCATQVLSCWAYDRLGTVPRVEASSEQQARMIEKLA